MIKQAGYPTLSSSSSSVKLSEKEQEYQDFVSGLMRVIEAEPILFRQKGLLGELKLAMCAPHDAIPLFKQALAGMDRLERLEKGLPIEEGLMGELELLKREKSSFWLPYKCHVLSQLGTCHEGVLMESVCCLLFVFCVCGECLWSAIMSG
jgi:hypothetical protein